MPTRPTKPTSESRNERKERTRRKILDTALEMLTDTGFGELSLRGLTKEVGIVPTGFYRHFGTLDELGLALVEESFGSLRQLVREVRQDDPPPESLIDRSVDVLVRQLERHPAHYRFIGRERYGGVAVVRDAIRRELDGVERELVTDLARMPVLTRWGARDLHLLAGLFVDVMVAAAGELVDPDQDPGARDRLAHQLRDRARMIVVGAAGWEPREA